MPRGGHGLGSGVRRPRGALGPVRPLCRRAPRGDSGERPVGPRPEPDNGQRAGFSPPLAVPGPRPGGARGSRPGPGLALGAWVRRGGPWTSGGVRACAARPLPQAPARGARLWTPLGEPADGQRPGNLPRARSLLIPSCLPAPGVLSRVPGSPGPVRAAAGAERDLAAGDLGPGTWARDADPGHPVPAGAAPLCLTSAKSFRTNSCSPNSDEPPLDGGGRTKVFPASRGLGPGDCALSGVETRVPRPRGGPAAAVRVRAPAAEGCGRWRGAAPARGPRGQEGCGSRLVLGVLSTEAPESFSGFWILRENMCI